ncbi:MAG: alkaline phosphatase D family protein [Myxococcota bacterium]|nr:alkaline phosphatase D family protein [Myxococcota bacterium]
MSDQKKSIPTPDQERRDEQTRRQLLQLGASASASLLLFGCEERGIGADGLSQRADRGEADQSSLMPNPPDAGQIVERDHSLDFGEEQGIIDRSVDQSALDRDPAARTPDQARWQEELGDHGPPDADSLDRRTTTEFDGTSGPAELFALGVASGDPLADRVILWTHLSLPVEREEPVEIRWEVAHDRAFDFLVQSGRGEVSAVHGWTFKVDAEGLEPARHYFYRFTALGHVSPLGRTRTAPTQDADLSRARFAVTSCANFGAGYFHVYEQIASEPDYLAVLALGDSIYEYGGNSEWANRSFDPPNTLRSLDDYRRRYAAYRGEASLRAMLRAHPFIPVWDDHELANNCWRDGSPSDSAETWTARREAAQQAYEEWMPIRVESPGKIWRRFQYGDLFELFMLDTRVWGRAGPYEDASQRFDPARQLLGADQEAWLLEGLSRSTARWKVIGQQVMMAQLQLVGAPDDEIERSRTVNQDQWDGFYAARTRLLSHIENEGIEGVIVLTGDIHSAWASELSINPNEPSRYDPESGEGAIASEWVVPAVASTPFNFGGLNIGPVLQLYNKHIKYFEVTRRGYLTVTLEEERAQGDWFFFDDVTTPVFAPARFGAGFSRSLASGVLSPAEGPAAPGQVSSRYQLPPE